MERGQTEHTAVSQGVLAGRDLTGGLRRQPRLDLRVPVRVSGSWSDGLTTFVPLLARSVNLSEGGMRVLTPLLLEPGSHVMCSLRLDGEPVYLAGRVAWQRGGPHAELKTMGIEFTQTSEVDQAPLRRALSRFSASHPVALRIDGHEEPVRAQARTDGSQLRIAARLPFLTQKEHVVAGQQRDVDFGNNRVFKANDAWIKILAGRKHLNKVVVDLLFDRL